jgi:hypothetical protein
MMERSCAVARGKDIRHQHHTRKDISVFLQKTKPLLSLDKGRQRRWGVEKGKVGGACTITF